MRPRLDPPVGTDFDRNGLEILDRQECLRLLANATLGRVGVCRGGAPMVLPVNFHFDGERIFVLTTEGTKLDAATADTVVAFEVDDFDSFAHTGWSVVATGPMRAVTAPAELDRLAGLPLARWAPRGRGRLVAISPAEISGRRIPLAAPREVTA